MQRLSPKYRATSSEFPNDNPACNRGALWVGTQLCTPLTPSEEESLTIEESDLLAELDTGSAAEEPPACSGPLAVDVRELAPIEHVVVELLISAPEPSEQPLEGAPALLEALLDPTESRPVAAPEPAPEPTTQTTPFTRFADAVIVVARGYMSARLAQKARDILLEGRPGCDLDDECREALARAHVLEGDALSGSFGTARSAFHSLLEGDSSDMNGCGEQTLDQWATDLIAMLADRPGESAAIRRALRKHKVAAFGMLD